MEIYFDNSATTKPYGEVTEVVCNIMNNVYGNPSSLHRMGKSAEDELSKARLIVSDTLGCQSKEIFFTGGGTESDNTAIIGYALANAKRGKHVITQKTEHMAVLESFKFLESQGFEVYYADVNSDGVIDADDVINHITDRTTLVSIMHVNNENGAVMPIEKLSSAIDHKKCVLHVDAVQSYGKIPINLKRLNIDMMSISSHKIHGPNGVGALYIKSGTRINPYLMGGRQENGMRSGTENIAGICGFAKACELKFKSFESSKERIKMLNIRLREKISQSIENTIVNSPQNALEHILNISFVGVRSEVLLHILESNGIYVSTGSACNSKKKLSYVLKAMGLKDNIVDSAIRFSFCEFNTADEIDRVVEVLKTEVPKLRKIMK